MPEDTPERDILVALVDDNRISREEHTKLLNAELGVTVISAEATLSVTMLADDHPDVVLVEAGKTDVVALRAAIATRRLLPDAGVVITDVVPDNEELAQFVKAGVAGFVLKEASIGELADAVRSVADGSHVLPDDLTTPLFVQIASEGIEIDIDDETTVRAHLTIELTEREQEIVALVRKGLGNKQIAAQLLISIHTVKAHVRSAMKKKGIRTRVLLAVSSGPRKSD